MIRFCCEHCGHKIGVQDEHTGRRGRCPKCGRALVVPERSVLIDFHCENCGRKISVGPSHAGRKGKCPECGRIVVVPDRLGRASTAQTRHLINLVCSTCGHEIHISDSYQGKLLVCPHCANNVETEPPENTENELQAPVQEHIGEDTDELSFEQRLRLSGEYREAEPEGGSDRKLPWPMDIFLYPTSPSGLVTIGVLVIIPLIVQFLMIFVAGALRHYAGILLLIFYIMLYGYMFQYFVECIRDSAAGGLRAPETMTMMVNAGDLFWEFLKLLACYAVFLGPLSFYKGYMKYIETEPNSIVFWSLWAYGIFFFPIGILATTMFGSVNALNPILLIRSIISTLIQYCGLLVFFAAIGLLAVLMFRIIPRWGVPAVMISSTLGYWLLFTAGHLLGRFYWRYREKLNWEV